MTTRFYRYLGSLLAVIMMVIALHSDRPAAAATEPTRLCNDNSIIRCGAMTSEELLQKYDANATGDLDDIYTYYGMARTDLSGATSEVKIGRVYKEAGRVTIGTDQTVATNSYSAGRKNLAGSTPVVINGVTYYQRSDTQNYSVPYFNAFILLRDGQFYRAIMMECGNPVMATPVAKPTPGVTIVKKVDAVDHKTVNLNQRFTYTLTVTNTGNTTLKNVAVTDTPQSSIKLESAPVGTITNNTWQTTIASLSPRAQIVFSISAMVPTYSAGNLDNTACVDAVETTTSPDACDSASVEVPVPKNISVCDPATGEIISVKESDSDKYKPSTDSACADKRVCVIATKTITTIAAKDFDTATMTEKLSLCDTPNVLSVTTVANTGPTDIVIGSIGLGTLTAAGYYLRASRRQILSALLK